MKNRLGGKSLKILKEQQETLNRRTYHHQKEKRRKDNGLQNTNNYSLQSVHCFLLLREHLLFIYHFLYINLYSVKILDGKNILIIYDC
jgi:hypothetical protein